MTVAEMGAMAAAAWTQIQNPAAQPFGFQATPLPQFASLTDPLPPGDPFSPSPQFASLTGPLPPGELFSPSPQFASLTGPLPPGERDSQDSPPQSLPPNTQNPTQKPPLEPSGHPLLPDRDGRLPAAQEGGPQTLRIIEAERISRVGDVSQFRGRVHLQYRGYDLFGREIDFNHATRQATLRGGGQLIGKDSVLLGETMEVDFEAETFRVFETAAEVRPGLLQGRTLDNVYLQGGEIWGSEREIFGHDCGLTTCTYDKPHYLLDASSLTLRPNKRIILRKVHVEVLGKRLFTIPYLSIPLDTRREGYTPEVGRTPDQGYYIKTRWGIPTRGPTDLLAYVDYFEKLGLGLGGRFRYGSNLSEGYLRVYGITGGNDTFEVQQGHKQLFGPNLFQIENTLQQRNYLNAPQNTIFNTRASISFPQGRNNTRVSLNLTDNKSDTFHSTSQTWSINDIRSFGQRLRTNLDVAWVQSESSFTGGGSEREQVDVRFRGQQDLKQAQAELEYQRSIPVGDTTNFFNASDRTPVFALRTNSDRLFSGRGRLPFYIRNAELSVGEFVDPVRKDQVTRTNFDINIDRPDDNRRRFGFGFNARFKQGWYSDDTAQYAVGYGTVARYTLGYDTALNFRYNYLEREGFTPLTVDRIGKTNLATADLSFRPLRTLLVGVQSGYDFLLEERGEETAWQQTGVRIEWRPRDWFNLRALPTYDPLNKKWSNVRIDMAYLPGATYVALGARYDGIRKVWGATNLFVDGLKWGRLKTSALLSYNGYLKKYDSRQFSFTYDLHCAEAILQIRENNFGFRNGREIAFYIRLKAFPFDTPFGLNPRGAPIGTATGRGF